METPELTTRLIEACAWWRSVAWASTDPDLAPAELAPFDHRPNPLAVIVPGSLFVLRGPRRVGKSVEVKRAIASLLAGGVDPRSVFHFACNGLTADDIQRLVRLAGALPGEPGAPRWWFLDEVTAAQPGWEQAIAHLRDNTPAFRAACVVLTGSSMRGLDRAVKAFAGRRGARGRDIVLQPMGFADVARALAGTAQHVPPRVEPLVLHELSHALLREAVAPLVAHLPALTALWEQYLRCGGFPNSVSDTVNGGETSNGVVQAMWEVVWGEALRSRRYPALQVRRLLHELTMRSGAPLNLTRLARECGFADHSVTADRLEDLDAAFLTWPCHLAGDRGMPRLRAQRKVYFTDPLLARLAHLLDRLYAEPGLAARSEQQLGVTLLRHLSRSSPGATVDNSIVMFARTATGKEIDFVMPAVAPVAFESKYADVVRPRDTATLRARRDDGIFGVIASRSALDIDGPVPVVPVSFLAWLLDPPAE